MEEVLARKVGYCGRLAPSPTGALHIGNARTFMIAWLRARSLGGRVIMRIEDLDHPRDKPAAAEAMLDDLRWLGFDWDEEMRQSGRRAIYREALEELRRKKLAYPCICTRRDVENAQSAPHAGEQLRYPGTCRGRFDSYGEAAANMDRDALPCWRFAVERGTHVDFEDVFSGKYSQDVFAALGDFPLARDPDGAGYTLAATVDDLATGVTEVVRGDDLLPATPPQILVARALQAGRELRYCHVPIVTGPDGRRLAKRHGDTRIASYRAAGVPPEAIIGALAASCGWIPEGERATLTSLIPAFSLDTIPHEPLVWSFDRVKTQPEVRNSAQGEAAHRPTPDPQASSVPGKRDLL